ncbi:MAG: spermidine synthase [Actinobacteria bacterium]|nr:spermidine synthase [Actinomycetota bacterium]
MGTRTAEATWPAGPVHTGEAEVSLRAVGPRQVVLVIDGMESSFHDLDDPSHLEFEYMQHADAILAVTHGTGTPVRALHLGGAGCSLATAWDATRPGSAQLAIEWDAELARLVREWFPLPRSPRLRIRHGDARAALDSFPPGRWDVVVRDAFVHSLVPDHLRDAGAASAARRTLAESGVYVVNLADTPPLRSAREEVRTLRAVFAHVVMVVDPAIMRGRRYGNVVVAASDSPIDDVALARRVRALPLPARVVAGEDLSRFGG